MEDHPTMVMQDLQTIKLNIKNFRIHFQYYFYDTQAKI